MCLGVCVNVCHMYMGNHGGRKGTLDPLKLELKAVVIHLQWVLRTGAAGFSKSSKCS